ncbi:hypothetical protein GF391_04315 [Candidatus Uhrbacteria bacterium]|nr:hypothetical protein [Candidatus Uhrbacteria bacterium]
MNRKEGIMSVANEKALIELYFPRIANSGQCKNLLEELIARAQVYHFTVVKPARDCQDPEEADGILRTTAAVVRQTEYQEAIRALRDRGVDLPIRDLDDFCEAVCRIYPKPSRSLPPVIRPKPVSKTEGANFLTKLLDMLRKPRKA